MNPVGAGTQPSLNPVGAGTQPSLNPVGAGTQPSAPGSSGQASAEGTVPSYQQQWGGFGRGQVPAPPRFPPASLSRPAEIRLFFMQSAVSGGSGF